jgi:uncharacterized protein
MRTLLGVLTAVLAVSLPALADATQPRTITVQGEAKLAAAPDEANVEVGVTTQNAEASKALAENSTKMTKVLAAIRALGIKDADIKTAEFFIQPRYAKRDANDFDGSELRAIVGYAVTDKTVVTVADLAKVSKVIDTAVDAGANDLGQISFSLKDIAKLTDDARTEAVKAAHRKAEVLTKAAQVVLGQPLSITDNQADATYNNRVVGNLETITVTSRRVAAPIQPGQIAISSSVTVVYEIK